MTSTVFVDQLTPVPAAWLNDVNAVVYGPTSPAGTFRADLIATPGAAKVGFTEGGSGAVARIVQDKLREYISNIDYPVAADFTNALNALSAALGVASLTTPLATITALTTASINGGQIAGRRNSVINGNGLIQQLPVAPTLTAALQYGLADMHLIGVTGGTGVSGTVGVLSNTGFSCGVGYGAIAASWTTGQFIHKHRMPGVNTKKYNSKTVTVSGKIYQDTGGSRNITVSIGKPTTTLDTFSAVTNLGTSSAIPVPSATVTAFSYSLALGSTDASLGIEILITDNAANTVSSKNYAISDLQFELGSTATTFEQPDEFLELQICRSFLPVFRCAGSGVFEPIAIGANFSGVLTDADIPITTRSRITGVAYSSASAFQVIDVITGVQVTSAVAFLYGSSYAPVIRFTSPTVTQNQPAYVGFKTAATSSDYIAFTGAQL